MKCWFCSIRESELENVLRIEMYGEVDAKNSKSQTNVAYKVQHIEVPRCNDCHSRHKIVTKAEIAFILLFIAFAVSVLFAVFAWTSPWIWGIWMGLAFGLIIAAIAVRILALRKIYSVHQARTIFPEVKEFAGKCYRFGYRPKGQIPVSDEPCDQVVEKPEQPN